MVMMKHMRRLFPIPFALLALVAAAPTGLPEDLIRRANAAYLAGDGETAESLYAAAELPQARADYDHARKVYRQRLAECEVE